MRLRFAGAERYEDSLEDILADLADRYDDGPSAPTQPDDREAQARALALVAQA